MKSQSVYFVVMKGTFHRHAAPAQALVEVLLSAVQLTCVKLHEPGQKGIGWVPNDEGWDDDETCVNTGRARV